MKLKSEAQRVCRFNAFACSWVQIATGQKEKEKHPLRVNNFAVKMMDG